MLYFKNWKLSGEFEAQQYDHNTAAVNITGVFPSEYVKWELYYSVNGNLDILPLEPTTVGQLVDGLTVLLTRKHLYAAGQYSMQIVGTTANGAVKHSNKIFFRAGESLDGDAQWPEIPQVFTDYLTRAEDLIGGIEEFAASVFYGDGRFVLSVGRQFFAEYLGNNIIRVYDGKIIDNGVLYVFPSGEHIDLTIESAGNGMNRNDLIVFQFPSGADLSANVGSIVVVQGTETSGTAADPELPADQMALWRVSVSGTTVSNPVQLFTIVEGTVDHIESKANPHSVKLSQLGVTASAAELNYLDGLRSNAQEQLNARLTITRVTTAGTNCDDYVDFGIYYFSSETYFPTNAPEGVNGWLIVIPQQFGDTSGFVKQIWTRAGTPGTNDHRTFTREKNSSGWGAWSRFFTTMDNIPIENGGTGASTAADARTNLGALSNAGDTFAKSSVGYGGPDTSGSVSLRSAPAANGGSGIWLYGNDHANGGKFRLQVYGDGYGYTQLDGSPDGSLTWGKRDIRVEPPMESGVEYLTAEKWANSPVYCTRIDYVNTEAFGSASGEAEFSIPHGITGIYRIVRCDASKGTTYLFPYISTSGGITAISAVTESVITIRTVNTSWSANSSAWHFILYYTKA